MSGHHFSPGRVVRWSEVDYVILGRLDERKLNLSRLKDGEVCTVSEGRLLDAFFRERTLSFPVASKGEQPTSGRAFCDYPEHLQRVALERFEVIEPLLDVRVGRLSWKCVEARLEELKSTSEQAAQDKGIGTPNARTVFRWVKRYRDSHLDLRSLIPAFEQRGSRGKHKLAAPLEDLIEGLLEQRSHSRETSSVTDLHTVLAAQVETRNRQGLDPSFLRIPGRSTVYRRARAHDLSLGPVRRARQYPPGETLSFPLERVEIDHWKSDLIVIDDADRLPLGRLTLTYMLCATTRYPLGYYLGFEPPGGYALAECFVHAVMPKASAKEQYGTEHDWQAYGLPARVRVDNGWEFKSAGFKAAMNQLGVTLEYCPPQTPQFKGRIERMFRTLGQGLFHTLPGTTFSNLLERQKKNYDSLKEACIPLSSIDRVLNLFLLDDYAEDTHRGLGGVPARAWERALKAGFQPRLPSSVQELALVLGESETRKLWAYGLDWDNLRYQSQGLADLRGQLRGQAVQVKRQRADLSRIYVWNPLEGRWLEVPIVEAGADYARGLSLWKHRVVSHHLRQTGDEVDLAALGQTKLKIQALVEAAYGAAKGRLRSSAARWQTNGKATRSLTQDASDPVPLSPPELLPKPPALLPLEELTPTPLRKLSQRSSEGWSVVPAPTLPPAAPRKRGR